MMRRIVIYHCFEIVKIPIPFTDQQAIKNRPALIISSARSFNCYIDYSAIAMTTSVKHSAWPLDTIISDLKSAGLPVASLIRLKLFTLDHRLIIKSLGHLSTQDKILFKQNFSSLTQ